MNTFTITPPETDLASRQAATRVRAEVEGIALAGEVVTIDLGKVLSLSESYADELLGVLVARHGLEWFAEHIAIVGASPIVFRSIAVAIRHRLEASAPDNPNIALLVARKALESRHTGKHR